MSAKRTRKAYTILAALLVAAGIGYTYLRTSIQPPTPPIPSENAITVIEVTDGDTFVIQYNGVKERLRLIGVDAPESKKNPKAVRDAERTGMSVDAILELGKKSETFLEELISEGDAIRLEFDKDQRDRYGRLLAYVYMNDGRMVNEYLLEQGFAEPMSIRPNKRYAREFEELSARARADNKGLWALGLQPRIAKSKN